MGIVLDYYSKPPYGTKIQLSKGICSGMSSAFLLNEFGANYAYDSITGVKGTIYDKNAASQPTFSQNWVNTPFGPSCQITNVNGAQFAPFPCPTSALTNAPFSISFFMRPGALGSFGAIWGTGNAAMEIRFNTSSKLAYVHEGILELGASSTTWTGSNTLDNNNWQHGAVTYDGATITFYYNGNADGTAASSTTFTGSQPQAIFGPGITTGGSFPANETIPTNSTVVCIYVWNRVVGASEIRTLHNDPWYPVSKKLWGFRNPVPTAPLTESLSDTLSLSDSVIETLQPALSLSDQIVLTDLVLIPGGGTGIPITLGDTFVFNDANSQIIQLLGHLTASLSDQISLGDAESNAIPIGLTIKDPRAKLALSDSVKQALLQLVKLNDQLTLTDLVQDVLMPIANLQPSDTFTFTDAVVTNLASIFSPIFLNFTDQLAINDLNLILKSPDYLSVVDTLNLQDSVIVSLITDLNPYIRRYLNDVLSISNPTPSSGGGGAQTGTGGSGGTGGVLFYDDIAPSGLIDGNNTNFSLPSAPNPPSSLELFLSGVLQIPGTDYTLVGSTIVFTTAPHIGSTIVAFYRG